MKEILVELKSVKTEVQEIKSDITIMKSDIIMIKSEMTMMKSDITMMKSEISDIRLTMATKEDLKGYATKKDVSVLPYMHEAILKNVKQIEKLRTTTKETQEEVRHIQKRQLKHEEMMRQQGRVLDLLKMKTFDNELLLSITQKITNQF